MSAKRKRRKGSRKKGITYRGTRRKVGWVGRCVRLTPAPRRLGWEQIQAGIRKREMNLSVKPCIIHFLIGNKASEKTDKTSESTKRICRPVILDPVKMSFRNGEWCLKLAEQSAPNTCAFMEIFLDKSLEPGVVTFGSNHSPLEVEVGGSSWVQGQSGVHSDFKTNWNYILRPCLKVMSQVWWQRACNPRTQDSAGWGRRLSQFWGQHGPHSSKSLWTT